MHSKTDEWGNILGRGGCPVKAQLLKSAPVAGICPERWYGIEDDCIWVIFRDENHRNWIGAFKRGCIPHFSIVLPFSGSDAALVVACGRGYVVDVNSRQLLYQIESDALVDGVAVPSHDLIIVTDCYVSLRALTSSGEVWHSDRLSLEGIRFEKVSSEYLIGRVWQLDGCHSFALNLQDWNLFLEPLRH